MSDPKLKPRTLDEVHAEMKEMLVKDQNDFEKAVDLHFKLIDLEEKLGSPSDSVDTARKAVEDALMEEHFDISMQMAYLMRDRVEFILNMEDIEDEYAALHEMSEAGFTKKTDLN
jgi:hypothetical protein